MRAYAPHCFASVLLIPVLLGCVSVTGAVPRPIANLDELPLDALRRVASEIEREVLAGNREASFTDNAEVIINDPAILHAIRTRAARSELVLDFLLTGHAWERQDGRIWILRSKEYKKAGNSREKDRDAVVVMSENENRWTLYEGIAKQNGWSRRSLPAVEKAFFEERLKLLAPGIKYEDDEGEVARIGGTD